MVSKKKAVAMLLILGLGGYGLYKLTQSQAQKSGTGGTSTGLTIKNYSLSYDCGSSSIIASGQLVDKNGAVPNNLGKIGFCSAYDPNSNDFKGVYYSVVTDNNGYFKAWIGTATPSGGANCIIVRFTEGNDIATAQATITIPSCSSNQPMPMPINIQPISPIKLPIEINPEPIEPIVIQSQPITQPKPVITQSQPITQPKPVISNIITKTLPKKPLTDLELD
jgi:hypothetical protein